MVGACSDKGAYCIELWEECGEYRGGPRVMKRERWEWRSLQSVGWQWSRVGWQGKGGSNGRVGVALRGR